MVRGTASYLGILDIVDIVARGTSSYLDFYVTVKWVGSIDSYRDIFRFKYQHLWPVSGFNWELL